MILVISHEQDPHATTVIGHLVDAGQRVLLLNVGELPDRATLSIDYGRNGHPRIEYKRSNGEVHALDEVTAVWWRRPQTPNLAAVTDPSVHLFTANEWNEAINGLWQLLNHARWMNDPLRDDAASRKMNQLRTAAEIGLKIPRTLITSDPARVPAFLESCPSKKTVYKTFSCTHQIWRETRLLRAEDLAHLETVRLAPVIFQEFIPVESDLRITSVGGRLFPAAIKSASEESIDFRMTVGEAEVVADTLPKDVSAKLLKLMNRLGLVYGAIDMRRTPDGEYYFFEVNTAGEFLFIEERTALPIARAIAGWLSTSTPLRSPS